RYRAGSAHEHGKGSVRKLRIGDITVIDPIVIAGGTLPQAVAAVDDTVILGADAIPIAELQAGRVHQVHLFVDRGLDIEVGRRDRTDCQSIVGQGSAIVDD